MFDNVVVEGNFVTFSLSPHFTTQLLYGTYIYIKTVSISIITTHLALNLARNNNRYLLFFYQIDVKSDLPATNDKSYVKEIKKPFTLCLTCQSHYNNKKINS